jgi:hypothetical protein
LIVKDFFAGVKGSGGWWLVAGGWFLVSVTHRGFLVFGGRLLVSGFGLLLLGTVAGPDDARKIAMRHWGLGLGTRGSGWWGGLGWGAI